MYVTLTQAIAWRIVQLFILPAAFYISMKYPGAAVLEAAELMNGQLLFDYLVPAGIDYRIGTALFVIPSMIAAVIPAGSSAMFLIPITFLGEDLFVMILLLFGWILKPPSMPAFMKRNVEVEA